MKKLNQVKDELLNSEYTCVISDGEDIIFTSKAKGVKPLMDYYREHKKIEEVYIADRIVGKGAAILAKLVNAKGIYTPIISKPALKYCETNNIYLEYEKEVDHIINRTKDGKCPIESVVLDEEDVHTGYKKIKDKIDELMGRK